MVNVEGTIYFADSNFLIFVVLTVQLDHIGGTCIFYMYTSSFLSDTYWSLFLEMVELPIFLGDKTIRKFTHVSHIHQDISNLFCSTTTTEIWVHRRSIIETTTKVQKVSNGLPLHYTSLVHEPP